ncbi:MAG: hypothetical protein ACTHU0_28290 [Kofleriaceae bacterium]
MVDGDRYPARSRTTSASWLNQVEGFFGIRGKQLLSATTFPFKRAA